MSKQAVTNSTCLIGLERIGRLDLLPQIFDTVFAPPTVAAEVHSPLNWLTVQTVENSAFVAALSLVLPKVSTIQFTPYTSGVLPKLLSGVLCNRLPILVR